MSHVVFLPLPDGFHRIRGVFTVWCVDREGREKWQASFQNAITTQGDNLVLNVIFGATAKPTNWYVGLVDGAAAPTFAAGDQLSSHSGWTENAGYSGNRSTYTIGAVAAGAADNSASLASFAMTTGGTIAGAFLTDRNTGSPTTGNLYNEGAFSAGNRVFQNGDTLKVQVNLTAT